MDESRFDRLAADELKKLDLALGKVAGVETDSTGDVITIEFDDGTKYVVNSHRAARQIWLAAELFAAHFTLDEVSGRWLDDRAGDELHARLARAISDKLGAPVAL